MELSRIFEAGETICDGIQYDMPVFAEQIEEGLLIRRADEFFINREQFQVEDREFTQ